MLLDARLVVDTCCIALRIGVFVDDSDVTVLLQVFDVGCDRHIERSLLEGQITGNLETMLVVDGLCGNLIVGKYSANGHGSA